MVNTADIVSDLLILNSDIFNVFIQSLNSRFKFEKFKAIKAGMFFYVVLNGYFGFYYSGFSINS